VQQQPPRRESLRRRLRFGLAWWAGLFVLWLLFVDSLAPAELVAGVVAAAAAASVAESVRESGYLRFAPRARWLRYAPALAVEIVSDCGRLAGALWRQLVRGEPAAGSFVSVPFHHGEDTSTDAARRALVNLAVTITPNTYVIDFGHETVLIHKLVPGPLDAILEREQRRADEAGTP
jgi:multisubunit Na+/H+ antiporter MnhE subunit